MAGWNMKLFQAGLINEHSLEYRERGSALPARPENKKSIKGWRVQTLEKTVEAEATSHKRQATSFKQQALDKIAL